ncbi:MAG: FKBP-type peptidyl-prolyl cis-trans isomerase [Gammaproteobacteria bacterium]|nr:FKBP-type peptidyl-prolyl cis-trans isomerase [Gammaproteobacteria bacterium]
MSEQRIRRNKLVQFTYSIADDEGNIVEQVDLPVNYVHGASSMGLIERVERALEGHREGDTIEVEVPPSEGFGEHDPDLTFADDIDNVPPQFRKVGTQVEMANDSGDTKTFIVTKVENGKVTLDGNHPLAGKVAKFAVKVLSIRDATPEEIRSGADNPNVNVSIH